MSFKDQIKQDLSDIFLNLDEFADLHRIEGKEVPVVIDSDIMAKLSKIGDNRIHGMDEADMVIMGKASDLPENLDPGRLLNLDGREVIVVTTTSEMGLVQIAVRQTVVFEGGDGSMTLVNSIDKIVNWLTENVCSKLTLKLPDDYRNDTGYDVVMVNPAAFPLYVPGKDRLPPNVAAPIPSVCVQLMEGSDELIQKKRQLQIRLCLACWNPGQHGGEIFNPRENAKATGGYSYYVNTGEAAKTYSRNMDGWRDCYNLADLVLREIETAEYIAGHRLVKEQGIKFGPFTEDGNVWDYYPYWHSWISFALEIGTTPAIPKEYEEFL